VSFGFGNLGTGFIPIIPYFDVKQHEALEGLWWSFGIMAMVLILFGYLKTCAVTGWTGKGNIKAGLRSAHEMVLWALLLRVFRWHLFMPSNGALY
jgi:vacuolar iron transporter family protein